MKIQKILEDNKLKVRITPVDRDLLTLILEIYLKSHSKDAEVEELIKFFKTIKDNKFKVTLTFIQCDNARKAIKSFLDEYTPEEKIENTAINYLLNLFDYEKVKNGQGLSPFKPNGGIWFEYGTVIPIKVKMFTCHFKVYF